VNLWAAWRSRTEGDDVTRVRTIIVPLGIGPDPRSSRAQPLRRRARTPWRDRRTNIERGGSRDWFSDHLFVERQVGHGRVGCVTSVALHACGAIAVVAILAFRTELIPIVRAGSSLSMPGNLSIVPIEGGWSSPASSPAPKPLERSGLPPQARRGTPATPAPVEAPADVTPDNSLGSGVAGGVDGGVEEGVVGGAPVGLVNGAGGDGAQGVGSPGPLRAGGGIAIPRKIKDVRPVYPQAALVNDARATVIVEITIGADGRVKSANVVFSAPPFDQPALDAVRQWEYAPTVLNGTPVAIVMTVVINFAVQ
jgi:protein TonB